MPLLDVNDVILDPDFLDELFYTRLMQTIGADGMAVNTPTKTKFYGVVTSMKGQSLQRQGDGSGEYMTQTIMVITTTQLDDGGTSGVSDRHTADIVTWDDQDFTVVNIDPYSRYGRGFVQATCEMVSIEG
jgi:hypothetical protein